ncbi:MAG: hypothetical protein HXY43_25850 [Fischerella sp.]|uniref:hypothetical protein n=1 Tax=Fischerella sp. TaxID=1191 RepID=UPI0017AD2392|nr:hypothetical protein [Fischerella sp.]NWF62565.1 hypothetical protein [Fischerella sp.]
MTNNEHNLLFRVVSKSLKYFLLALVGFAIAYVVSIILGGQYIVIPLLPLVRDLILRLGIILFCLMATAIVVESLR